MKIVLFSSRMSTLRRLKEYMQEEKELYIAKTYVELEECISLQEECILFANKELISDELILKLQENEHVKIVILDQTPSVKYANWALSIGVRAYINLHSKKHHVKEMLQAIKNDMYWYYPKFLEAFYTQKSSSDKIIAKVADVKSMALLSTQNEESMLLDGELLYENQVIILPYEYSFIKLEFLSSQDTQEFFGEGKILLEESVYSDDVFSYRAIFDEEVAREILLYLGEIGYNNPNKELKEPKKARYSGDFNEYNITASKNMKGYFVISDKIKGRDGSDLISDVIDEFIFKDVTKSYHELIQT